MERVGEVLTRANESSKRRVARLSAAAQAVPSKAPMEPMQHHGAYTALMRSHDRIHNKHLSGKNGMDGA